MASADGDYYDNKPNLWSDEWFQMFKEGGEWIGGASGFQDTVPPEFNSYHPYVCNACKRGPLQGLTLRQCSSCKVMQYCCREHQQRDWRHHKAWCKAFVHVMNSQGGGEDSSSVTDMTSWRQEAMRISPQVMGRMDSNRSLVHTDHAQVVHMQPRCRRCFQPGRRPDVKLVTCPICTGVAVCERCLGDEPQTQWQSFHAERRECEGHLIALCCSGMVVENGSPLLAASDTNEATTFAPGDWYEYFETKGNDFDSGTQMPISLLRTMAPVTAFLTDGLSIPLTMQHVLSQLSLLDRTQLCIHVLGAAANEVMALRILVELARLNPQCSVLDVVLVGPDLPEQDRTYALSLCLAAHESPVTCGGQVRVLKGLYHQKTGDLRCAPDLRIAFNAGITDPIHFRSWRETLELLASEQVPFCVTGYNKKEVTDDVERLRGMGFEEEISSTSNPFRSMRPFLDPNREESDFIYSNAFYAVLKSTVKNQQKKYSPRALDKLVRQRYNELRRQGKGMKAAMKMARSEYGLDRQDDVVKVGSQVAAMFGISA